MAENPVYKLIAEREHYIYECREDQLEINLSGFKGGRPYVDERLSRFPGESKAEWEGSTRRDGSQITGRKAQSHSIPYLGRIVEKINQHVLGVRPERVNSDEEVLADITSDGESINSFMRCLNSQITVCRWAWIGLDMADVSPGTVSQADKERYKLRPYWKLYTALDVVDWYIDSKGGVQWVLTEEEIYSAVDPRQKPVMQCVRRLWELGKVTTYTYKPGTDKIISEEEKLLEVSQGVPLPVVPFVLVGELSADPHQFDNLESINKTIMDLESCNRSNFFHSVFPQPFLPASALDNVKQAFEVNADAAASMLFGQGYPVLLNQGDAAPGYIMPDASAIGTMRTEIDALRNAMFDVIGLMLAQETRQVASAEAKAWDYLDVAQVMRERAEILEDAEKKAIAIMTQWDSSIQPWEPVYNRTFDAGSFSTEIQAITQAMTVSMPDELTRFLLSKLFDRARKIGTNSVDPEEETLIAEAIKNFAPAAGAMTPFPATNNFTGQ